MSARTSIDRLVVLSAAVTLLWAMPGCSWAAGGDFPYDIENLEPGERALVTLPLEFEVAPGNRLYVDGMLIERVHLSTGVNDSLYLNGIPILPHRPCPKEAPLSEETYRLIYGSVPYVRQRMQSGASARDAAEAYLAEHRRIVGALHGVFMEARESGKSRDTACAEAFAALREIDELEMIDWDGEVWQSHDTIVVTWKGLRGQEEILLLDPGPEKPEVLTEKQKRRLATRLYELLGQAGAPCWYVITCGGTTIAVGETDVARMRAHLEEVLSTGVATDGALSRRGAREILEWEGR
ncbi:hypothetical protein H8D73_00280 [bacterium]|nr:hypothetical protein [bacterium]